MRGSFVKDGGQSDPTNRERFIIQSALRKLNRKIKCLDVENTRWKSCLKVWRWLSSSRW